MKRDNNKQGWRRIALLAFGGMLVGIGVVGSEPLLARLYQLHMDRSLAVAIERGDRAMLERLLDSGADPNFPLDYDAPKPTPATYFKNALLGPLRIPRIPYTTPLMLAVIHKRPNMVQELLRKGALVDARDEYRFTPLIMAISLHQHAIVRILLEHGADPNATNDLNTPPLAWAVQAGDTEDVLPLLAHGADPNTLDMDGRPVLYLATILDNKEAVRDLLRYHANPELAFHGWTTMNRVRYVNDKGLLRLFEEFLRFANG